MTVRPLSLHQPLLAHEITPAEAVGVIVSESRLGLLPSPDLPLRVRTSLNLERLGLSGDLSSYVV